MALKWYSKAVDYGNAESERLLTSKKNKKEVFMDEVKAYSCKE